MTSLLGIIGGMGTQATAFFFERLHSLQKVKTEQEYSDLLLYSIPSTPDRTAFITGQSTESPLGHLINAAKTLESAGASCIAIPCVTSHYFYPDLIKAVNIPIINMLEETVAFVKKQGLKKVCLLATDGTVKGGAFHRVFEENGIEMCVPAEDVQHELMAIIYEIKRGTVISPKIVNSLNSITEDALKSGAEAGILGCTELCIVSDINKQNLINTLEVLAASALRQTCRSG